MRVEVVGKVARLTADVQTAPLRTEHILSREATHIFGKDVVANAPLFLGLEKSAANQTAKIIHC
jgi:hypothetical protein